MCYGLKWNRPWGSQPLVMMLICHLSNAVVVAAAVAVAVGSACCCCLLLLLLLLLFLLLYLLLLLLFLYLLLLLLLLFLYLLLLLLLVACCCCSSTSVVVLVSSHRPRLGHPLVMRWESCCFFLQNLEVYGNQILQIRGQLRFFSKCRLTMTKALCRGRGQNAGYIFSSALNFYRYILFELHLEPRQRVSFELKKQTS